MDFFIKNDVLNIVSNSKTTIYFDTVSKKTRINDLNITYPWEYEMWWILCEVMEYEEDLFYSFSVDSYHIVIVANDKFELKEKILSFFWDVDVLLIVWSKEWAKIFENIEARMVIPYWSWRQIFLATLWQSVEEVTNYKLRSELPEDTTEFVNLAES